MKKLITLLFFIALPLLTVAQNNSDIVNKDNPSEIKYSEVKTTKAIKPANVKSVEQIKAIDLNHKKSFELISIKAYRKSLQIKVKTVKSC